MYYKEMKDRIVILGSGCCNLAPGKAAASVLIEKRSARLVYDFGRGVATRLTEFGLKQDDVEHAFISHFHPDHVTDLYPYLHAASWSQIDRRTKDINIYGPSGIKAFIDKMLSVFDWKNEFARGFKLIVHEVTNGKLRIGDEDFEVVDLHHSHGLRFGSCAVAGDANLSDELAGLLKDVEIGVFDSGHVTDDEIIELAKRTQAQTLICSHQYRELDEGRLNSDARTKDYTGRLVVAEDLMQFDL
jgi:ribonuclease BN (tRNA processing enzyme)